MDNYVTQNNIPLGIQRVAIGSSESHDQPADTSVGSSGPTRIATVEPKIRRIATQEFEHLWAEVERNLVQTSCSNSNSKSHTGYGARYIIGVTSAVDGEGKTTVAENLAESASQSTWRKVCLIDLSLNSDDIADRNGINCVDNGIISLLERCGAVPDPFAEVPTYRFTDRGGLTVVPAGKIPDNAAKIARSPDLPVVIAALREHFDLIIIDLPSVASGNLLPLAGETDGIVFVTRAGATPTVTAKDAIEVVGRSSIVGLVLNRVKFSGPEWIRKRLL